MCSVDDPGHCQTYVCFDTRRPPTPQKITESMWAAVNMLKQEILLVQPSPQCPSVMVRIRGSGGDRRTTHGTRDGFQFSQNGVGG